MFGQLLHVLQSLDGLIEILGRQNEHEPAHMTLTSSCSADHGGVFVVQPFDAYSMPFYALLDLLNVLLDPLHLFLHGSNQPFTDGDLLHERLHLAHTHLLVFAGLLKY